MRILDFIAGALGILLLGPPFALLYVLGLRFEVKETRVVTQGARLFWRLHLVFSDGPFVGVADRMGLAYFPDCIALLLGRLALVGPRPLAPLAPHAMASYRIALRPGLVSPFAGHLLGQTSDGDENDVDFDYALGRSWRGDLNVLLRALFVHKRREKRTSSRNRVEIDGIQIDSLTLNDAAARILAFLSNSRTRLVSFVDASAVNLAARQVDYGNVLRHSDLVLGDGQGVRLVARLLGNRVREGINARNLFPRLCGVLQDTPHSIYLLGGQPGVTGEVCAWIQSRYPDCRIAGFYHGSYSADEEADVIRDIARSKASLLLVGFGAPRQEVWLRDHLAATGARVGLGVGDLFEVYSGRTLPAPSWMRATGLSWAYRLGREPMRLLWFLGPAGLEFLARCLRVVLLRRLERSSFETRTAH